MARKSISYVQAYSSVDLKENKEKKNVKIMFLSVFEINHSHRALTQTELVSPNFFHRKMDTEHCTLCVSSVITRISWCTVLLPVHTVLLMSHSVLHCPICVFMY